MHDEQHPDPDESPPTSPTPVAPADADKTKPFKFVVRLPIALREQIADAAKYYRRSMNSEIVARLEQSFSGILSEVREEDYTPPMHPQFESVFGRTLAAEEEQLLHAFRRLSTERQAALLDLLS